MEEVQWDIKWPAPHWCKHNSNIGGNTSEEASMEGETICVRKLSFIFELCLGISKGM